MIRGNKKANGNALDDQQHLADPFPKRLTPAEKRQHHKLSAPERRQWQKALKAIEKGWKVFVEVGSALREIRNSRLYREDYDSWEAFCREVVGMSKTEANRQILDVEVVESLQAPNGVIDSALQLPENRAQARALALEKDPAERQRIWQQLVGNPEENPITAKAIESVISRARDGEDTKNPAPPPNSRAEPSASTESPLAGLGVLETLQHARRECDWSLVDRVICYLEVQEE